MPKCRHRAGETQERVGQFMAQALRFVNVEGDMISPVTWKRAPLDCQWILFRKRSDYPRPSSGTRALCIRIPETPRIVTEKDCEGCRFWEPAAMCES